MNSSLVPLTTAQGQVPALVVVAGERASMRFLEFFAANIRNPHTRRAYARAADEFLAWCAAAGAPNSARCDEWAMPGMSRMRLCSLHPTRQNT
jgi:hypothetical protein